MKILFTSLLLAAATFVSAQQKTGEIDMVKGSFGGFKFYQDKQPYSAAGIMRQMASNKEAYNLMQRGRNANTVANIIGFFGGAMMGWPVGTAAGGGEMNWALFGSGVAVSAISFAVSAGGTKEMKQAVEKWNSSLAINQHLESKTGYSVKLKPGKISFIVSF